MGNLKMSLAIIKHFLIQPTIKI